MIEFLVTMVALWLLILVAPTTPIGSAVRSAMVERPAMCANRLTRGHFALFVIACAVIGVVAWAGESDGLRMLVMAAPEVTTWLTTVEIATVLDVAMAAIAAWSATRLRIPSPLATMRRSTPRRRRSARKTADRTSANDDEPADRRYVA